MARSASGSAVDMGDQSDGASCSGLSLAAMMQIMKQQMDELSVKNKQLSDQVERLSAENAKLLMLDKRERDRVRYETAASKREKRQRLQDDARFKGSVETRNYFAPLDNSIDEEESDRMNTDEESTASQNVSDRESTKSEDTIYNERTNSPRRRMRKGSDRFNPDNTIMDKQTKPKRVTFKRITLSDGEQIVVPEHDMQLPTPTPESEKPAREKFPPMLLVDKDYDPLFINNLLKENDIETRKPIREARQGFEIFTFSPDDYRKLIRVCTAAKIKYVNWQLDDEKELRFVVRNVSTKMSTESIEEDLKLRGYPVTKVTRITSREKGELPMVAINTIKNEKGLEFYNIRHINNLQVKVEAKRKSPDHRQCYRCQRCYKVMNAVKRKSITRGARTVRDATSQPVTNARNIRKTFAKKESNDNKYY